MQHITSEQLIAILLHKSVLPENGMDDYEVTLNTVKGPVYMGVTVTPNAIILQETAMSKGERKAMHKRMDTRPAAGAEWFDELSIRALTVIDTIEA